LPTTETKKQDNDPESLVLRRYHDGAGNFRVKIRVLNYHGIGLLVPINVWYKGVSTPLTTDDQGDAFFDVPGKVIPGKEYELIASVSGVAQDAKLMIKRRKTLKKVKMFSRCWRKTNNGIAFILLLAVIATWVITLSTSGNGQPIINPNLFRDETGLSKSEQYYNKSVAVVIASVSDSTYLIKKSNVGSCGWDKPEIGIFIRYGILIIVTIIVLIYSVFSLREEIGAGIEEGVEKLFDKDYAKAGDPAFERLAKLAGSYHVARTPKIIVEGEANEQNSEGENEPAKENSNNSGHPGLATLFRMDLLSDALITIVPFILKKIF
jgi:hypothetical protein